MRCQTRQQPPKRRSSFHHFCPYPDLFSDLFFDIPLTTLTIFQDRKGKDVEAKGKKVPDEAAATTKKR